MSTRSVFVFEDEDTSYAVYVHFDGYPRGAACYLQKALESGLCWAPPRFEADEFAAGFVAANKTGPGGVRLTSGPDRHGDLEYVYRVSEKDGQLWVKGSGGHDFEVSESLARFLKSHYRPFSK